MFNITQTTDCSLIQQLAHRIWPHAFQNILSKEQIAYMLESMYSIDVLEQQLSAGVVFAVASSPQTEMGFIAFQLNTPQKEVCKIHKLYVLPQLQNKGVGKQLFMFARSSAAESGCFKMTLNVNRFNPAVNFYKHLGMRVLLEENIDIGSGFLMEDYVMILPI